MSLEEELTKEQNSPNELTIAARRLDCEVRGKAVQIGERTVQPIARLAGWYGGDSNERSGLAWAWLRLTPTAAVVHEADGREYRVPVFDATAAALRRMAAVALVTAIVGWLLGYILRRRRKEGKT